jgi:hypothetical protein
MKRICYLLLFAFQTASGQTFYMTCHKDNGGEAISLKLTCPTPMTRFYLYQWEFNNNIIDSVILATPATEVTFDCLDAGNYGVRSVLYEGGAWTAATAFEVCWTMSGKISVVQPPLFYISAWPITSSCTDGDGEIRMTKVYGGVGDITYILKNEQGETIREIINDGNMANFNDLTDGVYLAEARDANGCYNSFPQELTVPAGNRTVTVDIIDKAGTCAKADGYIIARARSKTDESYDVYTYSLLQDGKQIGWQNITGIFGGLPEGEYRVKALNQVSHCESTTQPIRVVAEESMDVIINTEIP